MSGIACDGLYRSAQVAGLQAGRISTGNVTADGLRLRTAARMIGTTMMETEASR